MKYAIASAKQQPNSTNLVDPFLLHIKIPASTAEERKTQEFLTS
jgi:hypothetical protein